MRATAAIMTVVMYFTPAMLLADQAAHAAPPIVDPRAPVQFQPTITQTGAGVPAVNITAPNAAGLSVNQYSSFGVDAGTGLVLNNSLVSGTPLLGGALGANPNLAGRTATTILNQVTSTAPAILAGPLEVFGSPASVIVAAPNGVSVSGLSLTNAPGLVLTTGVPQFITGPGGAAASFANAGAVAFAVSSGNVSIHGAPGSTGANGPGAGIEGTVGNIDLIGQSVSLNAPLYANQAVNVVTGNQTVTPTPGSTGSAYWTSNVVAGQPGAVAVDASAFGSVTAGQVFIVSTAAGQGVNLQGPLAATAGNVSVSAAGDIVVGKTFGSENVTLASGGNVSINDTGLANQNYTVTATGDIKASGSVAGAKDVSLTAGHDLDVASVAANGQASLVAGNSMTIGSLAANAIALDAKGGDLTINQGLTAPGVISANAGRDLTVNGAVQGGSTVALTGARHASVNGSVSGVGDTSVTAGTGSASIAGSAITNGRLDVNAGQDVTVGGALSAQGPINVTATAGSATLAGTVVTPGALTVSAGQDVALGGQTQAQRATVSAGNGIAVNGSITTVDALTLSAKNGDVTGKGTVGTVSGDVAVSAGRSVNYGGAIQSGGAAAIRAGVDATLANVSAPGAIRIEAARDINAQGGVASGSTVALAAGRNATVSGAIAAVGDTTIAAQGGSASVAGDVQTNGTLDVRAAQDVALGGKALAQGPVTISATGGSIMGQGSVASNDAVSLAAGQDVSTGAALQAGTDLAVKAGRDAVIGGTVSAPGAVSVDAGRDATLAGAATSGLSMTVAAGRNAAIQGAAAAMGDMTLGAATGSLATSGDVVSIGKLIARGQQGVDLGGTVYSQGDASIAAGAGSVSVGGTLTSPGSISVSAAQDVSVAGVVHSGGDTGMRAGGNVALDGGLEADGTGNANVAAGGDITGAGAISVAHDTTLTAGRDIALTGAVQTGHDLSVTAAQDLSVAAVTAVGKASLAATAGSATLTGDALSGGDMSIHAGTDVDTRGGVQTLGNLDVNAGRDVNAAGPVAVAGDASLSAGGNLALGGATTVQGNVALSGANIAAHDVSVDGNLNAKATQTLDTTAGALAVNGTAALAGATIATGNAVIGGRYSASAVQALNTTGTGAYLGDASLAGASVTNSGTQMAAGTLGVSGASVTNTGGLSGLAGASVDTNDLVNTGSIYGSTATIHAANSVTNTGALLATHALSITTNALNNAGGLIFAGDVNDPTAATGDVNVTVTGGDGAFNNTNGQILGQNSLTLNLPQQNFDPSAASVGTLNGGNAFALSVAAISNGGTWTLPGTNVTISASQGITNSGTIGQGTGSLTLNGDLNNTGTVTAQGLTLNGNLTNAAGATVQANDSLALNGSGTNRGTVEAQNNLSISGASYDNSGATTRAGSASGASGGVGNLNINVSGDLTNAGGTITATNDLSVNAARVVNSGSSGAGGATTTTTTTIDNPALLLSLALASTNIVTGSLTGGENGFCCDYSGWPVSLTLADILSPTGAANPIPDPVVGLLLGSAVPTAPPVATSGTVTFVQVKVMDQLAGTSRTLWFVETPENAGKAIARVTVALPTVTETTTTTGGAPGASGSVIAAGHDLNLNANTLLNSGGTVSAGNDANIHVQTLDNSGSTYRSTVTDSVDLASLNAFLSAMPSTLGVWGNYNGPTTIGPYTIGAWINTSGIKLAAPGTVTPLSTSSSVSVQGGAGQIVAGHDVNLSGGDLTNAGSIAATNNVNITSNSFTNQGTNVGTMTTTAGCAAGYSAGCATLSTTNPNSESYSYQQTNANVTAGNDIVVGTNALANTYGNLVAGHDVVIGGAGTSASSTTQAASVTNTSGAIAAGHDVTINAASVVNSIAAPVQVHQNYGSATPYTGCASNCEAYVDVQSAAPATITASHDVNVNAGSFANTGSLVTGLNNVTINASGSASNDNQYLGAYWHANLKYYDASFPAWGCAANPGLCASLYGSAWQGAQSQGPAGLPSGVGLPDFIAGTIQAGNALAVNSPTLTNTGNVIGPNVALTGSTLVNGLTNPNVYTPPPAVAGQVISLGPPPVPATATTTVNAAGLVTNIAGQPVSVTGSAGLPSNSPIGVTTVGKPVAPGAVGAGTPSGAQAGTASAGTAPGVAAGTQVKTIGGQTFNVSYLLNSPASAVTGDLSPAALIAQLPPSLQPDTTQFYYDPYTQAQQVEQAALKATGQSSFYALPSQTDSANQQTINNLDTAALYGAALDYAKQNNVALGTQLSADQLAKITAPMLWYVEQTVPQPGCTATGNASCPTVQALMPQVLLPQNWASVSADGEISGTNVALNYANSILNTGTVSAQNLTVNTGTLTNEQRSTNVGDIYTKLAQAAGVMKTTGTAVQEGGFMSAANYDLTAGTINQIGGALQQLNADGSANSAATAQLLAGLKDKLGGGFTQSTVADNLQTSVVADNAMGVLGTVFMITVIVIISVGAAYVASGAVAAMAAAQPGTTFAAAAPTVGAGVGNASVSAAVGGMANSAMGQSLSGNGFSFGTMLAAGATAFVTAGLTSGITYADGAVGFTTNASSNSLAALAGVQPVGNVMIPGAGAATGSTLQTLGALAAVTGIQAGTQTAIQGGSLLENLRNDAAANAAAAGAFAIGEVASGMNEAAYIAAHAGLGCAAGAASGKGCSGGAIGGAVSAAFSPDFINGINPGGGALDQGQMAVLAGFATALGGGTAALAGANVDGAVAAAMNEAMNNSGEHPGQKGLVGNAVDAWNAFQNARSTIASLPGQFVDLVKANNGQTPPSDPNRQISDASGGNNTPPTAGAVVTPLPCPAGPGACGMVVTPVVTPGAPILADGGGGRPSPAESERDVGADLGPGHDPQVSYKNGQQVPYGTSGSVRPDHIATDGSASFEVKNYNIATNSSGLINNVAKQAIQRAANLPEGMQQQVVIDVRGQSLTAQQELVIRQGIVTKSNGIISPDAITFKGVIK
ncbi:two-partner secretion domain-containing protein [Paraburkholderia tropica]|uniref:two-partner secretion domain-containing protein n=1 Tax=Paraburkholderia tropica TaxID=92647 RepID=UPI002AB7E10F|nr:filamentous hemagglutinin N-terminal domain-containing protein [Paraburkholderia tropica]